MSNAKVSTDNEASEQANIVGDKSGKEAVVFFTGSNYNGSRQWDRTYAFSRKIDLTGQFKHGISSMVVLRGQCETTGTSTGTFNDESSYYNANGGLNGQGCWETLGANDNSFTAIRIQRPDIERNKNIPYLILRNDATPTSGPEAIILTEDSSSLEPFTVYEAIAVGSDTGKWYLYSEPDYKGSKFVLDVSGGDTGDNLNDLGYYQDMDFPVRSVSTTDRDGSYWKPYASGNFSRYRIWNRLADAITIRVTFNNDSEVTHAISPGEYFDFDVEEDRGILISGDYQEVKKISLNNTGTDQDLIMQTGSNMRYNPENVGAPDFEVLRFYDNTFLASWDEPTDLGGQGPAHFTQDTSTDTVNLFIYPA